MQRNFICLAVLALMTTVAVSANAEVVGHIKSLSRDKTRVLIQLLQKDNVQAGAKLGVGDFCDLKIIRVKGLDALASTAPCSDPSALVEAASVHSMKISQKQNEVSNTPSKTGKTISNDSMPSQDSSTDTADTFGYAGQSTVGLVFNDVGATVSTSGASGSISLNSTNDAQMMGVRAEYSYLKTGSLGFIGGMPLVFKVAGDGGRILFISVQT